MLSVWPHVGAHKTTEHQSNMFEGLLCMKYYGRYKVKQAVVPSSRSLLSTEGYQCPRKWVTGKMGSKRGSHLSSVEWGRELFLPASSIYSTGLRGWQDSPLCRRERKALECCWALVLQLDTGKLLAKPQEDSKVLASPGEVWQHRCVRGHPEQLALNFGVWALGLDFFFPQETRAWLGWKLLASGALVVGQTEKGRSVKWGNRNGEITGVQGCNEDPDERLEAEDKGIIEKGLQKRNSKAFLECFSVAINQVFEPA